MSLTKAAPANTLDFLPNRDFDVVLGADIVRSHTILWKFWLKV